MKSRKSITTWWSGACVSPRNTAAPPVDVLGRKVGQQRRCLLSRSRIPLPEQEPPRRSPQTRRWPTRKAAQSTGDQTAGGVAHLRLTTSPRPHRQRTGLRRTAPSKDNLRPTGRQTELGGISVKSSCRPAKWNSIANTNRRSYGRCYNGPPELRRGVTTSVHECSHQESDWRARSLARMICFLYIS